MEMYSKLRLEREAFIMTIQQRDYIENTLEKKCVELKKDAMTYMEDMLNETLEQTKVLGSMFLHYLIANGDLELPDNGYEKIIEEFINENGLLILDTTICHRMEEAQRNE